MYRTAAAAETSSNRREFAVGIDLGTTNSCVAVWLNGQVKIIPADDHGGLVTPSCVAFTEHERIIGAAAFNQMAVNPANSIFDAKRLIGRNFSDPTVQEDIKLWPFKVIEGERGKPAIVVKYRSKETRLSAEEISSMLLEKLRGYAEVFLGTEVRKAVITVPAYFSDSQRKATIDAGMIAGLNVMRIVNEPTAAAIAYGLDRMEGGEAEGKKNVLIFDLGGGTFDVSILEIGGGKLTVKATGGDTHLGGEDFDHRLVEFFAGEFRSKHGSDISGNPRALRRLRTACEKAKRNLSISVEATVEVDCLLDRINFESPLTRAKFEDLNKDLFEKCMKIVESCLNDADMAKESIDDVVLVGGSTRIVKIQELLREFFGGKQLSHRIHPDEAVAHGAALQAAMLNGDLQDMVLRDVVPLSLGVKTYGGLMSVVVPRNTTVPTVQEKTGFTTVRDWQTCVDFNIYEGERELTEGNNLLGHCQIVGIPPAPEGLPQFTVRFSIDEDGLLHVLAVEQCMGNTAETRIDSTRGILLQEEIERMVRDAERYREEDEARRKKVVARNALETFAYQVRNSANSTEFAARLSESESSAVTQALAACFERLEVREVPELSECDEMKRELEEVWRPIVTRVLGGPP